MRRNYKPKKENQVKLKAYLKKAQKNIIRNERLTPSSCRK